MQPRDSAPGQPEPRPGEWDVGPPGRRLALLLTFTLVGFALAVGAVLASAALFLPSAGPGHGVFIGLPVAGVTIGLVESVVVRRIVARRTALIARNLRAMTELVWQATQPGGANGRSQLRGKSRSVDDLDLVGEAIKELLGALRAERTFRIIVENSGDLVILVDEGRRITFASTSCRETLGMAPEEMFGQPVMIFVHADDLDRFDELAATAERGEADELRPRLRLRTASGGWRVLEWVITALHDGGLNSLLLTGRDVTDQAALELELVHQATHDLLTGLPNRKALIELAGEVLRDAGSQEPVAIVMIDLDRFKDVNDSLGHAVGDQLLAQVGPRLRSILRPTDTIARLGGDEFAVLLPWANAASALVVAERLAAQLEDPFLVDGMELHVEASLGVAVSHQPGRAATVTVAGLLREADIAMYRAKEGRTVIATFDPERDSGQARSRLEMSADLRKAIGDGQLVVYYQPVVDVLEGRLSGVEALVRWQHPTRGLLPPAEFLPLAEQTGLILPLSREVLEMALAQAAEWAADDRAVQIAVNLSPRWLQLEDVPAVVERRLQAHGVPPSLLRLELTESVVLADPDETLPMLLRLRGMGVGLSLDDFGTGFSSLSYLRNLPVDELKVDRAFVQAMTTMPQDAVIVRTAIELGHNLGMAVVAEGVEDADILAEVVASGCALLQGYYFSRPLPPKELRAWWDERLPAAAARPRLGTNSSWDESLPTS